MERLRSRKDDEERTSSRDRDKESKGGALPRRSGSRREQEDDSQHGAFGSPLGAETSYLRPYSSAGRKSKKDSSLKESHRDHDEDVGGKDGEKSKSRPMTSAGRRSSRVSDEREEEPVERVLSEKQRGKDRPKTSGERRKSSKTQNGEDDDHRTRDEEQEEEVPMRKQKSEKTLRPKTGMVSRRGSRGDEEEGRGSVEFDTVDQRPRTSGMRRTKSKTADSSKESPAFDEEGLWPVQKAREGRSSRRHKEKDGSADGMMNASDSWGDAPPEEDAHAVPSNIKEQAINNWVESTVMLASRNDHAGSSSARRDEYHTPNGIAEEDEDDPDIDFRLKTVPATKARRSTSVKQLQGGASPLEPGSVLVPSQWAKGRVAGDDSPGGGSDRPHMTKGVRGLDLESGLGGHHGHGGVPPRPPTTGGSRSPLNQQWRSPFLNESGSGAPSMDDGSSIGGAGSDGRPSTAVPGKSQSSASRRKSSLEPGDAQGLKSRSGRHEGEVADVMGGAVGGSFHRPQTADPSAARRQKQAKQSPAKGSVVPRSSTEPDDGGDGLRRSGEQVRYIHEEYDEEGAEAGFGWGAGSGVNAEADVFVLGESGEEDGELEDDAGHSQVLAFEDGDEPAKRKGRKGKSHSFKGTEFAEDLDESDRLRLQREEEVDRQWEEEDGEGQGVTHPLRRRSSERDREARSRRGGGADHAEENGDVQAELEHVQKKYSRAVRKLREAEEDNTKLKEQVRKEKAERKRLQEEVKRLNAELRDSQEKRRADNEQRRVEKEELAAQVAALKIPQLSVVDPHPHPREGEGDVVVNGAEPVVVGHERKSPKLGILSAFVRPRTPEKERKEKTPEKERHGLSMISIQRPVTPEGMSARLTRKNREVIRAGRSKGSAAVEPAEDHSDHLNILGRPFQEVRDAYKVDKNELGRGRFGVIRACVHRLTGQRYACKTISKTLLQCAQDIDDVRREVAVMELLRGHPNVASLEAVFEDIEDVHLVMEMCDGGELFDRIKAKGRYNEPDSAIILNTVVRVLQHCHALGVMHRDLKPENILLLSRDSDTDLKVIDYGVACFFQKGKYCTDMAGSPYYLAPEVLAEKYGPEADIWSAGVVLYILLSGLPPFWATTNEGIFEAIKEGSLNMVRPPWPTISEEAKDLVRRMLTKSPKKRISLESILSHTWIQTYNR